MPSISFATAERSARTVSVDWELKLLESEDALDTLQGTAFQSAWEKLAGKDPKSTWFQEPTFVLTWYRAYAAVADPVVTVARDGDGRLVGLMALARTDGGRRITHAGGNQAEYHGWIADPAAEGVFPSHCVRAIFDRFSPQSWLWKYLPPGSPTNWLRTDDASGVEVPFVHRILSSPVWDVTDKEILNKRLRKGRVRNYINRYRRQGELVYERLTDPDHVASILEVLAGWCDLRLGALLGQLPFHDDPAKLDFYETLASSPDQVHLSVLRLGERPLAAHIGGFDGKELFLGVQGYDPKESSRSPGTILLFEMARDLAERGAEALDLTPGGDPWKERYATHHRDIHQVHFFRSWLDARAVEGKESIGRTVRSALRGIGIEPAKVKANGLQLVKRLGRMMGRGKVSLSEESRQLFEIHLAARAPFLGHGPWLVDSLADLLSFADQEDRALSQALFGSALQLMNDGWHNAILRSTDRLSFVAWIKSSPCTLAPVRPTAERDVSSRLEPLSVPDGAVAVVVSYENALPCEPETLIAQLVRDHGGDRDRLWLLVSPLHTAVHSWAKKAGQRIA